MAFCMKCGTKLPDEAVFCIKCGTKLPTVETESVAATDIEDKKEIKEVVTEVVTPTLTFEEVKTTEEPSHIPSVMDADENDDDDIVRGDSYDDIWEDEEDVTLSSTPVQEVTPSAETLEETADDDDDEDYDISKYFAGPDDDIEPPEELLPDEDGMTIEELSAAKRYHEELKAERSNFIQNRLNIDPIEDTYYDDVLPEIEEELKKINLSPIINSVAIIMALCALALYLIVMIPG